MNESYLIMKFGSMLNAYHYWLGNAILNATIVVTAEEHRAIDKYFDDLGTEGRLRISGIRV